VLPVTGETAEAMTLEKALPPAEMTFAVLAR
jgi:hypothetical protein